MSVAPQRAKKLDVLERACLVEAVREELNFYIVQTTGITVLTLARKVVELMEEAYDRDGS